MSQPGGSGGGGQAKSNADGQPETIKVSVRGQDGSTVVYKIARNVKLRKLMHAHCRKKQLDFRTARFIHEGHRVPGKYTADKFPLVKVHHSEGLSIDRLRPVAEGVKEAAFLDAA